MHNFHSIQCHFTPPSAPSTRHHPGKKFLGMKDCHKFPYSRSEYKSYWCTEYLHRNTLLHVIHPESKHFLRWDSFVLGLLLYTVTVTPYQAGFLDSYSLKSSLVFTVRCVVDVAFITDIFVRMSLAYYDPIRGHYIFKRPKIASRYFRSWFLFDLITALPLTLFAHSGALSTLRFLEMVKVARVGRARRILSELQMLLIASPGKWAALEFFLLVVCVIHVTACGLGLLYENENDVNPNWVSGYFGEDAEPSGYDRYIAALYWSVMTVTTVGYGDVPAHTNLDRLYMSAAMMIGGGLWAFILGSITSGMLHQRQSNNEISRSVEAMDQLLKSIKASKMLKRQINQYFVHQNRVPIGAVGDHETLPKLSPLLRKLVAAQGCGERLKRLRVFNFCPTGLIGEIALLLKGQTFIGGEMLVRPGERAHQLFILQSGIVFKRGETDFSRVHEIRRVRTRLYVVGQAFGMDFLLGGHQPKRRHYSVMAKDYVDCLLLSRGDLARVVDIYPDVKAMIRRNVIKHLFQGNVIDAINVIQAQRQREAAGGTPQRSDCCDQKKKQSKQLLTQHQQVSTSGDVLSGIDGSTLLPDESSSSVVFGPDSTTTTRHNNNSGGELAEVKALLLNLENRFEKRVQALTAGLGDLSAGMGNLTLEISALKEKVETSSSNRGGVTRSKFF